MSMNSVPDGNGCKAPLLPGFHPFTANRGDMRIMGKRIVVEKGDRYGRLSVIREIEPRIRGNGYPRRVALCLCDCGEIAEVTLEAMRGGKATSCGCHNKEVITKHGLSSHPAYDVWKTMNRRCSDASFARYENYGGRGIRVCSDWQDSPVVFIGWAEANGYRKGLQIDRKDNDGDYSPDNCQFVTGAENRRNTRRSFIWTIDGVEYSSSGEAAKALGVSKPCVASRCSSDKFPSYSRVARYPSEGSASGGVGNE